ncbi:MAG TPA: PIG-L family deacetylase [Ignavibacteria bacterium]|nr:PIG-L family deacetylase [Ignavibacteria bacterium]HMQ97977.1 PIG-L family deacetylase [Ignavibacteria bacterium]
MTGIIQNRTLLAVSAHPDDIEFSCGGTMFKFKELGYEIYFIVATNGENGFKIAHKPRSQRVKIRHNEQLKAAKLLGVKKVFFLNHRDCFLRCDDKLREQIALVIKKVKPEIIFSFDPSNRSFESVNLLHRDHRVISEAVFDAVFAARNRYLLPGETHYVKKLWFFGCDKPNHFENITGEINDKIKLIEAHRSQFSDHESMQKWVKVHLSKYTKKYKYSEKFRIVSVTQPFTGGD